MPFSHGADEPDFTTDFQLRRQALQSYTLVDNMLLFAKTRWLQEKVSKLHNVEVELMRAAVNLTEFAVAYDRYGTPLSKRVVHVVAMIRPSTERRNPRLTLKALKALSSQFGSGITISTFGCSDEEMRELTLENQSAVRGASFLHHRGVLSRSQVAELFAHADVFIDASKWQAFGRTGLEAMAAGCVPVLPSGSGASEYAREGQNAVLVNTANLEEVVRAAASLVRDRNFLERLRNDALKTAAQYGIEQASAVMLALLCRSIGGPKPTPC